MVDVKPHKIEREATAIMHRLGGQTWVVDRQAAGEAMAWVRREAAVWQADLANMAAHFPHWALVAGEGYRPKLCGCGGPLAPMQGGLCCVVCGKAGKANDLLWMGQLPVLARAEASFGTRREVLRRAGFSEIVVRGLAYLLVPLAVVYPNEWPTLEPSVYYAPTWLAALGLPESNASYYLVSNGRACLFGWGQWRPMSVAAVLQQRVVNHVVSLLKIAAGTPPAQAFIGQVAH
jgi:hypothetical protein